MVSSEVVLLVRCRPGRTCGSSSTSSGLALSAHLRSDVSSCDHINTLFDLKSGSSGPVGCVASLEVALLGLRNLEW